MKNQIQPLMRICHQCSNHTWTARCSAILSLRCWEHNGPLARHHSYWRRGSQLSCNSAFFKIFTTREGPLIYVYIYTLTYPTVYTGKSYYFRVWGWNIHWDFGWTIFFVETMLKIHPFHPSRIPQTCWTYGWWDLEIARGDVPLRVRCFFFLTSSMATRMDLRHPGFCIYF